LLLPEEFTPSGFLLFLSTSPLLELSLSFFLCPLLLLAVRFSLSSTQFPVVFTLGVLCSSLLVKIVEESVVTIRNAL